MRILKQFFFFILSAGAWAGPPNVLFVAVDDLRPLLGIYGNPEAQTPHFDRLGEEGTVFFNAACQFPVCGPSRASILTGLRPESTGVLNLKTKMRDVHPDILTLPQHFKNHGYTTASVGKIFDPRCVDSRKEGDAPSWSWPYNEGPDSEVPMVDRGKDQVTRAYDAPDEAFPDGRIGRAGIEAMRQLAAEEAPFFLAVGFKKPHLPFVAPQRHWDRYDPTAIELAAYQAETQGNSGYGYWNSNEVRSYGGVPAEGPLDEALQRELIHGYFACVSWIDELLGRLLGELDTLGIRENTLIVLWGDHGFHLGDHGLWGKHTPFEIAVRAPLIIVDPRREQVPETHTPVEFTDVFPTLCDLAGLPRPAALQGVSLVPALDDAAAQPRPASIAIYKSRGAFGYSVRTVRFRYIEWISNKNAKVVGRDLFDFKVDPLGEKNFAEDPEYAPIMAAHAKLLHADAKGWTLLQRRLSP